MSPRLWTGVLACLFAGTAGAVGDLNMRLKPGNMQPGATFGQPGCISSGAFVSKASVLTVTRAGAQSVLNSSGGLTLCPANTLAVSPTGAEVWGAATNLLLWSQDFTNAAWVKSNVTVAADAAVDLFGTTTADRLTATASGLAATAVQTIAGAGLATRTASIYMQRGTQGTTASVAVLTDGAAPVCTNVVPPVGSWTRFNATASTNAVTNTAISVYLTANCTGNATAGDNILVSLGQHGVSAYATPVIPTTTVAVTRPATVASIPLPDFSATDTACFAATYTPGQDWNNPSTREIISSYSGTWINNVGFQKDGSTIRWYVGDSTGALRYINVAHGLGAVRTARRLVGCTAVGTISFYIDGVSQSPVSGAGTALFSAAPAPLGIGSANGSGQVDGSISNVRVYPGAVYRTGM